MNQALKNQVWQIAEVFRGTKAAANINDIVFIIQKDIFKQLVKEEYQQQNFLKSIDFQWQSTAPDNSVEYVQGSFKIDKDKLANDSLLTSILLTHLNYNDGRSIFFNNMQSFDLNSEATEKEFEFIGGIRYFRDGYVSPVTLAEQHIENYFSVARLLQMKVWWDEIPHTSTPKLAAVYQWTADTTNAAIAGQTTFTVPPYTFEEITQEIASLS